MLALAGVVAVAVAVTIGMSDSAPRTEPARVQHLSEIIRCPVCDGLSVADSPSSTARAIAADIRTMVSEGRTDGEIVDAYVARYGAWIFLEPPTGGVGALAWVLPIGFAAGAAAVVVFTLQRRFNTAVGNVSKADLSRVEEARRRYRDEREAEIL